MTHVVVMPLRVSIRHDPPPSQTPRWLLASLRILLDLLDFGSADPLIAGRQHSPLQSGSAPHQVFEGVASPWLAVASGTNAPAPSLARIGAIAPAPTVAAVRPRLPKSMSIAAEPPGALEKPMPERFD